MALDAAFAPNMEGAAAAVLPKLGAAAAAAFDKPPNDDVLELEPNADSGAALPKTPDGAAAV